MLVIAAAGSTHGCTRQALQLMQAQARGLGARCLCFQTARRGLVRLAQREGFNASPLQGAKVAGWWLEKTLDPEL